MPARVTILCGPAGAGKTERLVERFAARARSAPGAALWLGPTRRAVETVCARVLEQTRALCGSRLATFQDFTELVLRDNDPLARSLSGVQRRLLAEEVVARLDEEGQLDHFTRVLETRGFAEGLLGLLVELKRGEISPLRFARAIYRGAPGGRVPGRKDRQCARIYARYQRELRRQHLYDVEDRAVRAADLLRRGARRPFADVRAVFVDGFTDFTPSQHALLEALTGWVEEVWLTLPDEPGAERAELFARPRATLQRLQALVPEVEYLADVCEPSPKRERDTLSPLSPRGRGVGGEGEGFFFTPNPSPPEGRGEKESPLTPNPSPPEGRGEKEGLSPTGLVHLRRQLFRPLRAVKVGADGDGLTVIEAPGVLGEARLVARAVRQLLDWGVPPDDVVVTLRDVVPAADLLREVFEEYGLPLDVEGDEPLTRNPAVALLLRALRLPDEDWPFLGVTALLRNTYFRPDWSEAGGLAEMPQRAEVLLRLLGEPRGRDAYLAAVRRWAERPDPGLEDEQAEESRRQRIHEFARQCGPFLYRFFAAWDDAPATASLEEHADWLRRFAADLGLSAAAAEDERDRRALSRLWAELDEWVERERRDEGPARRLDRRTFQRRLAAVAAESGLPRTGRGPGRVRVLSAALARHLEAAHVFVMGLGERSFPRLAAPPSLFDEQERQTLKQAGLDLPGASDYLPEEMLLFYQVVTRARRHLTLSYPAVDERGQELLPSSFLLAVLDCFRPEAIPRQRRRMLLEGFDRDPPLSPAEYRVRVAAGWSRGLGAGAGLSAALHANLSDALDLVRVRLHTREYNPHDGLFRDPAVVAQVAQLFGPERVFSPTALEDYVACPFRFFLRHVLRLEPLEPPREEIEVTRRGQAVHRALARLHRGLKEAGVHEPGPAVAEQVLREVGLSVEEDVLRAPGPASKELWRLEGQRLLRVAARYVMHWQKFLAPWRERGVRPRPHFFEVDFGLPAEPGQEPSPALVLRGGEVEVRISGRIDRVDVAELADGVGFWIIDYKTGRGEHYTGSDLAQYRRLQLTLYALAVEEVLLGGRGARPLGLAYWLVGEGGPKVALPGSRRPVLWLDETKRWQGVRAQLEDWVVTLVSHLRRGAFPLAPRSEHCTQTCPYGQVCRIGQARAVGKEWSLPLPLAGEG